MNIGSAESPVRYGERAFSHFSTTKSGKDEKDFIYSMYVIRLCLVHDGTRG